MLGVAVTCAMDRKASQRELTSRLISDLYGESILDQNAIAKGMEKGERGMIFRFVLKVSILTRSANVPCV